MENLSKIEASRLVEQTRIDSSKNAEERNRLGQFATPPALAEDIARYVHRLWGSREPVRFLDPAIGTGSFYSALRKVFTADQIRGASGIELDPLFVDAARNLWSRHPVEIQLGDFTVQSPPEPSDRFNLVLTNPPYVRHHHLSRHDKARLKAAVFRNCQIDISGLAGLYCYFMLLADGWLADNGIGVWLIPSEFMDVNYGVALKRYLADHVTLLQIHRFSPADVQFADALVTSAIVVFEKAKPSPRHQTVFSYGSSINEPELIERVTLSELRSARKWSAFPKAATNRRVSNGGPVLSDYFAIKRGLATGSNTFFVLPRERAQELGIPYGFLRPILPSPRYLKASVVEADEDGYPTIDRQLALIDCDAPEDELRVKYRGFWEYLQEGRNQGVHEGYLASRRSPWYSQERRNPAPFLCTYMGRSRSSSKPFRFIWNRSSATAANVYLMLYPIGSLKAALERDESLYRVAHDFLQGIEESDLVGEGRVYGGGLHKVEPKELGRVSAASLIERIGGLEPPEQSELAFG
jgi:adenine-specific DNA-methyltransferase